MSDSYICIGTITSPHGVKGEVKIQPHTQYPDGLTAYGPLYDQYGSKTFEVHIKRIQNTLVIATVDGSSDRNAAEQLRGKKLYVPREALPETEEEEFYREDLVNLKVKTTDGVEVGIVKAIHNFGAGDIIEIGQKDSKKTDMLPFTLETVPTINIEEGYVVIAQPEELIAKEGHD